MFIRVRRVITKFAISHPLFYLQGYFMNYQHKIMLPNNFISLRKLYKVFSENVTRKIWFHL